MQELFEAWVMRLVDCYLGDVLKETGSLAFAGGGALNVKLNQHLLARDDIQRMFVQPASGDSGTALGAATYVANRQGDRVKPMTHVYLGPSFDNDACRVAIESRAEPCRFEQMSDPINRTADLLAAGHPVAWFHGRMEFGPRALGGRSILGCPNAPGIADRINEQIKFRERWRPFCPSMLDRIAPQILQTDHPAPYMTITFEVAEAWRDRDYGYAGSFWLIGDPSIGVPQDAFAGLGNRGQYMVVVPSRDLVIVRRGFDVAGEARFDISAFVANIVGAYDAAEQARLAAEAAAELETEEAN